MKPEATVIGAGLAGCEAAWQLACRGVQVTLREMKPEKMSPAHHSPDFAELVCSNSLRGDRLENAVGLLKEELRRVGSLILSCAEATRVQAGGALAVDRTGFSGLVTEKIRSHPNIRVVPGEVTELPRTGSAIVATGPLTSDALAADIAAFFGQTDYLSFYDAAAPLVSYDSIDMDSAWFASRYDRGTPDYINCPLNKEEYLAFVQALATAQEAEVHGFEDSKTFEGCMPVEVLARRGVDTLRYGPLKPVGLKDPKTGREPYAVVQLRRDNAAGSIYNMVGFQTRLKWGEQKRVFGAIQHDQGRDAFQRVIEKMGMNLGLQHATAGSGCRQLFLELPVNQVIYFIQQVLKLRGQNAHFILRVKNFRRQRNPEITGRGAPNGFRERFQMAEYPSGDQLKKGRAEQDEEEKEQQQAAAAAQGTHKNIVQGFAEVGMILVVGQFCGTGLAMDEFSDAVVDQFVDDQWNSEEYVRLVLPERRFEVGRHGRYVEDAERHTVAKRCHQVVDQAENVGVG